MPTRYTLTIHRRGEAPRDGPWTTEDPAWARHMLVDGLTYHALFLQMQLGAEHHAVKIVRDLILNAQTHELSQTFHAEVPSSGHHDDPPTIFQLFASHPAPNVP